MTSTPSPRRGGIILGVAFIGLGGAALLAQVGGLSIGWPAWIIVAGAILVLAAAAVAGPAGSGVAALGGMVTMAGVVLAVQEASGAYQTWAYAWALVAPGGVGLGLAVHGLLTGRPEDLRGGLGALGVGIVLFLAGFIFFEGAIGLSGGRFGDAAKVGVPLALVAIGGVVLLGAFVPGPWRAEAGEHTPSTSAGSPAASGSATGGSPSLSAEHVEIPLEGAPDAEVMVTFGAGHLRLGTAAPGHLADGDFGGGVRVERAGGPGRVRLSPPTPPWGWSWHREPYTWTVGLTAEVPLRLRVETGAADAELDLTQMRLTELRVRTGASDTRVTLPAAAGFTRVDAEGGAATMRFRVPTGVAARIRSSIALGSSDVDASRFPRNAVSGAWESPDFERAANRVEIELRGGVGTVSVR